MNSKEKNLLIRLDERVQTVQSDISQIKTSVSGVKGCVNENVQRLTKTETTLKDHLDNHKRDLSIVGLVIALFSVIIGVLI